MLVRAKAHGFCRGGARRAETTTLSSVGLNLLRYGLPAALIVAGFVVLFVVDGDLRWDGWAMLVGSGLALLLLNVLFRYGAKGDKERDAEESAREYFAQHGRWPDDP